MTGKGGSPTGKPAPGRDRIEIVVAARPDEVAKVAAALDTLAARCGLPADAVADMQVALDEILANAVTHGASAGGAREVRVAVTVRPDALEAEVADDGAPFDPLTAAEPDRESPLEHRRIGGLGIHFVRSLMSELRYRRVGRRNVLVLRKLLHGGPGS